MSKLYHNYLKLKEKESNVFFLFKAGIFYIFIGEDAKIMSELLDLKLTQLNESVVKCGFPASALNKYTTLLNNQNVKYKIIEVDAIAVSSIDDYVQKTDALQIVKMIQSLDLNNTSPVEALNILFTIKKKLN